MKEILGVFKLKLMSKFKLGFDSKNAGDTISLIYDILRKMNFGVLSGNN
tara:strand:+ start:450 stop:596 length:147 start_codon:yes stop_codon:yes gene_type:complete